MDFGKKNDLLQAPQSLGKRFANPLLLYGTKALQCIRKVGQNMIIVAPVRNGKAAKSSKWAAFDDSRIIWMTDIRVLQCGEGRVYVNRKSTEQILSNCLQ